VVLQGAKRKLSISGGLRVGSFPDRAALASGGYPAIVKALSALPDETVIDGEIVALDESGRPSFNAVQNYGSSKAVLYYVFDVLVVAGQDVMSESLKRRRELLHTRVLSKLDEPIRESPVLASLADLTPSVKAQGLEGIVAKRVDSLYEPGQRSGAWQKMRLNQGQEFVIGWHTPRGGISTPSFSGITTTRACCFTLLAPETASRRLRGTTCTRSSAAWRWRSARSRTRRQGTGAGGEGLTAGKSRDRRVLGLKVFRLVRPPRTCKYPETDAA